MNNSLSHNEIISRTVSYDQYSIQYCRLITDLYQNKFLKDTDNSDNLAMIRETTYINYSQAINKQ